MSVVDRRGSITPEHQARLDGLADALTETVYRRILSDPDFLDRLMEAVHARRRKGALRVREGMLALLRSWEDGEDLPRSVPTKRDIT